LLMIGWLREPLVYHRADLAAGSQQMTPRAL
jgi:hypothetical protein